MNIFSNGFVLEDALTLSYLSMVKGCNCIEQVMELCSVVGFNNIFTYFLVLCQERHNFLLGLEQVLLKVGHNSKLNMWNKYNAHECCNLDIVMRKKQNKVDIIPPFSLNPANSWELIHSIETSLNQYLSSPHIYTNIEPNQQTERLGRSSLEQIIRSFKVVLQIIQQLRAQQKNVDHIKLNAQIAQQKLEQHQQIIKNYEKKFAERTKALFDQNRMLKESNDKSKRILNETEDNYKTIIEQMKQQNQQLQQQKAQVQAQNKKLLLAINELQQEVKNQKEKNYRLTSLVDNDDKAKSLKDKLSQLEDSKRKYKKKQTFNLIQRRNVSYLQWLSLNDVTALAKILAFLTPKEICTISRLNKQMRLLILKSKQCVFELGKSVSAVKNRTIGYYHRHIQYFQKLYNKIPEEILQLAYFKYHILKENVGQQIMGIMNRSATIFEGKFTEGEELYAGINQDAAVELNFKVNTNEASILEVDPSIVDEYKAERVQEREKLMKLFQTMYNKISNTFQLYRADVQSSKLFIENILKHFSKVFVLSKNLYIQAQNLQQLNNFLLSELNKWDRMEIDKNLKLEDIRAQLQAEKKLKLFFTDKSIKSEQKALIEQNLKLTFEMKHTRLTDLMNVTCAEKQELIKKNDALAKTNQQLALQCKQNRKRYQYILQKYNKVTQELAVVKQTIIKMNIV